LRSGAQSFRQLESARDDDLFPVDDDLATAAPQRQEPGRIAHGELFDHHSRAFGGDKMPELVDKDEDAQGDYE